MIAYAYVDIDRNIVIKDKKYIEEENLGFWQQNRHLILGKWKFDTDDFQSMFFMFRQIRDLKLSSDVVKLFASSINFDLNLLKTQMSN